MSNNIIKIINNERKLQGYTVLQLAQASNIAVGTLNKILSGTTKSIKSNYVDRLCKVLGIDNALPIGNVDNTTTRDNFGYVTVASSTVPIALASPMCNAKTIVDRLHRLKAQGVDMVCMQELGVSGYCCGDLLLSHALQQGCIDALQYIVSNTATLDILFCVGMPIMVDSRLYNCAVTCHKGSIIAVTPKGHLPNYNEFGEKRHFQHAPDGNTTINLLGQSVPFGLDIIIVNRLHPSVRLSVEICEDIWVAIPPSSRHANAGANIIFNLSASNERVGKAQYRRQMIKTQSAKCVCGYVYCSSGDGESTSDTVFGGHNMIAENGILLGESQLFENGDIISEIDTYFLDCERNRLHNDFAKSDTHTVVYYDGAIARKDKLVRKYKQTPFVPHITDTERLESILRIQSHGLSQRIKHINCDKAVIGVSGGLDSTLALLVATRAMHLLDKPNSDIIAITMPCFGTSNRTKNNALSLANALGCDTKVIDIGDSVRQHLMDIGHDGTTCDTAFENAQARERTQVLMDTSNMVNGLVVGTGDMSELALGFCTYNGDHMSMYSVNAGVVKTLARQLVTYEANRLGKQLKAILNDIVSTPVSPELLPTDNGNITQVTEDIIGPYVLHDYFLYHMLRIGSCPAKILYTATQAFDNVYDVATIYKWLKVFLKKFFSQQFKRNCMPDGVKVGRVSLSPRADWHMPSDAHATLWIEELDNYYNSLAR